MVFAFVAFARKEDGDRAADTRVASGNERTRPFSVSVPRYAGAWNCGRGRMSDSMPVLAGAEVEMVVARCSRKSRAGIYSVPH